MKKEILTRILTKRGGVARRCHLGAFTPERIIAFPRGVMHRMRDNFTGSLCPRLRGDRVCLVKLVR